MCEINYKQQADKIISDYYKTGRLKVRIDGYYKGKLHISRYTKIAEEIELQVWLELSKYPPQKLVERFNRNPNSIEALAVVIAKYQFMHKKSNPDSPNNSFGTKLVFGSNYFSDDYVSPTDSYNESGENTEYRGIPIPQDEGFFKDRDYSPDRWEEIQKRLTPDEIEFITALWNGERQYIRKPSNAYKNYRDYIYNKIKEMDLNRGLTPLEQIKAKLTMSENKIFDVMFDEDLCYKEKIKQLKFSEQQYLTKRRFLLKRIKSFNIQ